MRFHRLTGAILSGVLAISAIGAIPVAATAAPDAEGCSPVFWARWHNLDEWTDYKPWDKFKDVFDSDKFGEKRLYRVLTQRGPGKRAVGRHTVAALLNGAHEDVHYRVGDEYQTTAGEVIYYFGLYDARTSLELFSSGNRAECPLRSSPPRWRRR